MFLQFQQQIAERQDESSAETVTATDLFEMLPAAGLLPVEGTAVGFDSPTFFAGLTTRGPFFIEAALVAPVLRTSFSHPPIDLSASELIWLYEVHENRDSLVAGAGLDRPFVLFANGPIPYAANPRFDLAHWDFANFALDFT